LLLSFSLPCCFRFTALLLSFHCLVAFVSLPCRFRFALLCCCFHFTVSLLTSYCAVACAPLRSHSAAASEYQTGLLTYSIDRHKRVHYYYYQSKFGGRIERARSWSTDRALRCVKLFD
jgi:hypothetical protein